MEIDDFTERLLQLHQSLLDEKRFSMNLNSIKLLENELFKNTFERLLKELKHHIYKEEKILFPYLINLSKSFRKEIPFEQPYFESVKNPIEIMKSDHELINECLTLLKSSLSLTDPKDTTKNHLKEKWKKFLEDVEAVIYLENEVLFPRAIQIERSLIKK